MNIKTLFPGLAAIFLAVAFPAYWVPEFAVGVDNIESSMWKNVSTLNLHDLLFVTISLMAAYICYALMQKLHDELNYKKIDPLLWILIGTNILFTATIIVDITASALGMEWAIQNKDMLVGTATAVSLGCTIVFGVTDIIIGVMLLRSGDSTPTILKIFGAVTLLQGICEFIFVFVFAVVFIYPVSLILLAIFFIRTPETIEVV